MTAIRNTFKAYERLKREQHIDTLFRNGKAFSVLSLRLIYNIIPRPAGERSPVQVGFSVPKKKFRKAVHRNRVKRLLREAWRLNKQTLYTSIPEDKQLHLFIIYTDLALPEYEKAKNAVETAIERLKKEFS